MLVHTNVRDFFCIYVSLNFTKDLRGKINNLPIHP